MSFEFMYGDTWYKYEDGHIRQQRGTDFYMYFCPVLNDIKDTLKDLPVDQCQLIMAAIVHGYFHGHAAGQRYKTTEFKRVLNID